MQVCQYSVFPSHEVLVGGYVSLLVWFLITPFFVPNSPMRQAVELHNIINIMTHQPGYFE